MLVAQGVRAGASLALTRAWAPTRLHDKILGDIFNSRSDELRSFATVSKHISDWSLWFWSFPIPLKGKGEMQKNIHSFEILTLS